LNLSLTKLNNVLVVETNFINDKRGAFARLFCKDDLESVIEKRDIVQINYSLTEFCGTVRGLHFQYSPYCEMKLIRCIKGKVWDVVVDLRSDSPTFLQWHAEELSPSNARMIIIPEGCAHGFQTLEDESELLYLHTEYYKPEAEGGLVYNDPLLNIDWPLPVSEISDRDQSHPKLCKNFAGIKI